MGQGARRGTPSLPQPGTTCAYILIGRHFQPVPSTLSLWDYCGAIPDRQAIHVGVPSWDYFAMVPPQLRDDLERIYAIVSDKSWSNRVSLRRPVQFLYLISGVGKESVHRARFDKNGPFRPFRCLNSHVSTKAAGLPRFTC